MATKKSKKSPCWSGYEMVGMKKKGNKKVPNCVPLTKKKKQIMPYSKSKAKTSKSKCKKCGKGHTGKCKK